MKIQIYEKNIYFFRNFPRKNSRAFEIIRCAQVSRATAAIVKEYDNVWKCGHRYDRVTGLSRWDSQCGKMWENYCAFLSGVIPFFLTLCGGFCKPSGCGPRITRLEYYYSNADMFRLFFKNLQEL